MNTFYIETYNVGYVSLDDWHGINSPGLLLSAMSGVNEKINQHREEVEIPQLTNIRWIQYPALDRQAHALLWAVEAEEDGKVTSNSCILKFGRFGFVKISRISQQPVKISDPEFRVIIDAHSFEKECSYDDYRIDDMIADINLNSLAEI